MRQILKQNYSFSSTFKAYINTKINQAKEMEEIHPLKFHEKFKKLYILQKREQAKILKTVNKYEQICLSKNKPAISILKQFQTISVHYSEQLLRQTFKHLAKAYHISKMDHKGEIEPTSTSFFQNEYFDHLIEEFKYGIKGENYFDIQTMIDVLKSLIDIQYVDYEIIHLVFQKVEDMLRIPLDNRQPFQKRLYQIQKRNYYDSYAMDLQKSLLSNKMLMKNIDNVRSIHEKMQENKKLQEMMKDSENEDAFGLETAAKLLQSIYQMRDSVEQFVEAVINLRKQYHKLCELSNDKNILEDPSLNFSLLELQQNLLQAGFISIYDINNPSRILQSDSEFFEVQKIIERHLKNRKIPSEYFINKKEEEKQESKVDYEKLISIVNLLANYANLPYNLYGQDHKVSLINTKWQRIIIGQNTCSQYLAADRIFRKSFMEVLSFVKKHFHLIQYNLLSIPFERKILWFETLLKIGLFDEVIMPLKKVRFSPELIRSISKADFHIIVNIFNDVGSQINIDETVKIEILKRIEGMTEDHRLLGQAFKYNQLIAMINYMYQMGDLNNKQTYNQLIQILKEEIRELKLADEFHYKQLEEAYRILQFQEDVQHLDIFLQGKSEHNWIVNGAGNPYIKIVRQACLRGNKDTAQLPFILNGHNKEGEQMGIYIVNCDNSSLDGRYISGNIKAYLKRIKQNLSIDLKTIPIASLLQIDYDEKQICLKDEEKVAQAIKNYLEEDNKPIHEFITSFVNSIAVLEKDLPLLKVKKVLSKVKQMIKMMNLQKSAQFGSQSTIKWYQLIVVAHELQKDLMLLSKEQFVKLNDVFTEIYGKNLNQAIKEIIKEFNTYLPDVSNRNKEVSSQKGFEGIRSSLQLIDVIPDNLKNPEIQLINHTYYKDQRYVEYEDWQKKIKESVGLQELKIQNCSSMTKLLLKRFCPQVKQTLVVLPIGKIVTSPYPLNWQNKYRSYVQKQHSQDIQNLQNISDKYRNLKEDDSSKVLIDIQNFKHELKIAKNEKQICEFLLSFDFINDLMEGKKSRTEQKVKLLERDGREYFNYLERRGDKMYLESPYFEYLINKIDKTQRIKDLIKQRDRVKIKCRTLLKKGVMTKKEYFEEVDRMEHNILQEMKELNKKVLGRMDGPKFYGQPSKIIQIEKNIQEIERYLGNHYFYDKELDEDFIHSNGDHDAALQIKRAKAQHNMIRYRLIYKISQKQQLKENEKKYLEKWKSSIVREIQEYHFPKKYTSLKVKDLSSEDKQKLKLKNTDLSMHQNLALTDLVLQFEKFFDETILENVGKEFYANYFSKNYQLPSYIFENHRNKELSHLSHQIEQQMFASNTSLDERQMNIIKEMTKIFKTQSKTGNEKFKETYKNLDADLKKINKSNERVQLMGQYLKAKDYQYYNQYDPTHITQFKSKQIKKCWMNVFNSKQFDVTQEQLTQGVNNICRRLIFIKKNIPPYFGLFMVRILFHPKITKVDQYKLISYLELFKFPLELDSNDLLQLASKEKSKIMKLKEELNQASGKKMTSTVSKIMSQLS